MLASLQHILTDPEHLTEEQLSYKKMSWKIYGGPDKEISTVFILSEALNHRSNVLIWYM
jgi:hypothetical protein